VIGSHELVERLVMPGRGHGDEIADLEQQIRDLDMDDPAYLTRQAELMTERKRLKELPAEGAKVVEMPTGVTIGHHWPTLDTPGRRAWLAAGQIKVMAYKPAARGPVLEGAPSFTFSVEALMGEWTVGIPGRAKT
jgi:hypothetical protein